MDSQSVNGKAPVGIARLAKRFNKPVAAIVGGRDLDLTEVYNEGIDFVKVITPKPVSLEESLENVEAYLIMSGEDVIRAFLLGRKFE